MSAKLLLVCLLVHYSTQSVLRSDAQTEAAGVSTDPDDVEFYLYPNPSDPTDSDQLKYNDLGSITASRFNPSKRTIIYSSGFLQDRFTDQAIKDAYLRAGFASSANIIIVDWGKLSGRLNGATSDLAIALLYTSVKPNFDVVGKRLAEFIVFLENNGQLPGGPDSVHLVGQSLGAHISGMAGYYYKRTTSKLLGRITGTDAAAQLFQGVSPDKRLDASDAVFVDTLHTNDGGYGYSGDYGTADFYVNGGKAPQPGCDGSQSYCSHNMAVAFFAKSIVDTSLRAFDCEVCSEDAIPVNFGEYVPTSAKGAYYLNTTPDY